MRASNGMSAKTDGNQPSKLVDNKDKLKKIKERDAKDEKLLASRGYVYSALMGWITPAKLNRAGLSITDTAVPSIMEHSAERGWVQRIHPDFKEFLKEEKAEAKAYRANPQTKRQIDMLSEPGFEVQVKP